MRGGSLLTNAVNFKEELKGINSNITHCVEREKGDVDLTLPLPSMLMLDS